MPELDRLHDNGLCGFDKQYKQGACASDRAGFQVAVHAAPPLADPCFVMNTVWRESRVAGSEEVRSGRRPNLDNFEQYQDDTANRLRPI